MLARTATILLAASPISGPGRSAATMSGARWSSATASHILFKGSDAQSRAAGVMAEIAAGARSFEDTAADLSACPSGRRSGGSLGSFIPGRMVPAFDAAVFDASTALNQLYLVETSHGIHILRVDSRSGFVSEDGSYSPERGLQLGGYKSLTLVEEDDATRDAEPSVVGAVDGYGNQHAPVHPATARLWAMQQGERDTAIRLMAQASVGSALSAAEAAELRRVLAELIATLQV